MLTIIQNILAIVMSIFVLMLLTTAILNLFYQVPYVPSRKKSVLRMLELAELKNGQHIYDLGCGDGRFLIEACKQKKVQAKGFEIAPIPYFLAIINNLLNGNKAQISMKNLFKADLHDADLIFCYMMPEMLVKISHKIKQECKKGTRIFSNTFQIEGLKVKQAWPADKSKNIPSIYLYEI